MGRIELATGALDLTTGVLQRTDGGTVRLSEQEQALLGFLVARAGQDTAREDLLVEVLGYHRSSRSRAVDDAVKRLRAKIEAVPHRPFHLVSVRGVGYRFMPLQPAETDEPLRLKLGHREADLGRLQIREPGQPPVALSAQEGRLLEVLWEQRGQPVSSEDLLRAVWDIRDRRQRRLVDKAIYRLRSKLEDDNRSPRYLRTVRGRGLLLEGAERVVPGAPVTPPAPLAPRMVLLGRDALREQVQARLRPGAVVTLHGPAGGGKSVLARDLMARWAGPTLLVSLAGCAQPEAVESALAEVLGIDDGVADARMSRALQSRAGLLLVLDDAETAADALLVVLAKQDAALRGAVVLVTSRRVLGTVREQVFSVGPLAPDAARALFRARAASVGIEIADGDPDLQRLVEGVDCLPLALELAAGRLRLLGLSGLVERLHKPLQILRAPRGQGRHSSLRAALSWSWSSLTEPQRQLLAGTAVFCGPFPLDGAEAVMPASLDVFDGLQELLDLSLLRRLPDGRLVPYHGVTDLIAEEMGADMAPLLESLRPRLHAWLASFADPTKLYYHPGPADYPRLIPLIPIVQATLQASPPAPALHARMVLWVLSIFQKQGLSARAKALAATLPPISLLPAPLARVMLRCYALNAPEGAYVNIYRRAVQAHKDGDIELSGHLLGAVLPNLAEDDHPLLDEAFRFAQALLPSLVRYPNIAQRVHNGIGWTHFRRGSLDQAWTHLQEALVLSRRCGNRWGASTFAYNLAGVCRFEGRLAECEAFLHLAGQEIRATDNTDAHRQIQDMLGLARLEQGRLEEAAQIHQALYAYYHHTGNARHSAMQANRLGTLAGLQGQNAIAIRWFEAARLGFETSNHRPMAAGACYNLGYCAWLDGLIDEARRQFSAALEIYVALERRVHQGIVQTMLCRLDLEAAPSSPEVVARLEAALALLEASRARKPAAETRALLAFALAGTAPDAARRHAQAALDVVAALGRGPGLAAVLVLCARAHLRLGDRDEAARLCAETERLSAALGIRARADVSQQLQALQAQLSAGAQSSTPSTI